MDCGVQTLQCAHVSCLTSDFCCLAAEGLNVVYTLNDKQHNHKHASDIHTCNAHVQTHALYLYLTATNRGNMCSFDTHTNMVHVHYTVLIHAYLYIFFLRKHMPRPGESCQWCSDGERNESWRHSPLHLYQWL